MPIGKTHVEKSNCPDLGAFCPVFDRQAARKPGKHFSGPDQFFPHVLLLRASGAGAAVRADSAPVDTGPHSVSKDHAAARAAASHFLT